MGLILFKRRQRLQGGSEAVSEPDQYGPGWSLQRALHSADQYIPQGAKWLGNEVRQGILPDEDLAEIQRDPTSLGSIAAYANAALTAGTLLSSGRGGAERLPVEKGPQLTSDPMAGHARPVDEILERGRLNLYSPEEFQKGAESGKLHPATGKTSPEEEKATSPLESGETADYTSNDIAHFYTQRRGGDWRLGAYDMLKDAVAHKRPVNADLWDEVSTKPPERYTRIEGQTSPSGMFNQPSFYVPPTTEGLIEHVGDPKREYQRGSTKVKGYGPRHADNSLNS